MELRDYLRHRPTPLAADPGDGDRQRRRGRHPSPPRPRRSTPRRPGSSSPRRRATPATPTRAACSPSSGSAPTPTCSAASSSSQRVIDELDLDMSAATLADKIDAAVVPETVVLKITVTDPSPMQAQRINDGVVEQLQDFVARARDPAGPQGAAAQGHRRGLASPARLARSRPSPCATSASASCSVCCSGSASRCCARSRTRRSSGSRTCLPCSETPVLSALAYDTDVQERPLISDLPSHAPRAEAFRVLRTNLSFIDVDQRQQGVRGHQLRPERGQVDDRDQRGHRHGERRPARAADRRRPAPAPGRDAARASSRPSA